MRREEDKPIITSQFNQKFKENKNFNEKPNKIPPK